MKRKDFDFEPYLYKSIIVTLKRSTKLSVYRGTLISYSKKYGNVVLMLRTSGHGRLHRFVPGPKYDCDSITLNEDK